MSDFSLSDLETIVAQRSQETPEQSYTASLLSKGRNKCAEKFGEEAVEAIVSAVSGNQEELVKESADVLYHLLVMLRANRVSLAQVMDELKRRTVQSGHHEKASRQD